jgi:hypothetical protein
MPKRGRTTKTPSWKKPGLTPLEAVMEWAFEQHHDTQGRNPGTLNIERLLAPAKKNFRNIAGALPAQLRSRLSQEEKRILTEALRRTGHRNAIVHGRKVLQFMLDLFRRGSTVPPPWMA